MVTNKRLEKKGPDANLIKCRKRSWMKRLPKDRYLYVFCSTLPLESRERESSPVSLRF